MRAGADGSFTIEMALIFPGILVLLVLLIETGLWYRIRILADAGIQETLMICETARNKGYSLEEAAMLADGWLEEMSGIAGNADHYWQVRESYLHEEVTLSLWGSSGSLFFLGYAETQKMTHPDPRRFKDRVDLICEKLNVSR